LDADERKLNVKLAYGYYQNKDYRRAAELYEKLAKEDGEDVNVLSMLGDAYFKNNQNNKALDVFVHCINILEKKAEFEKIVKLARKVFKTFPDEPRVKNKVKAAIRSIIHNAERKAYEHDYAGAREIYEGLLEWNNDEFPISMKIKELNDDEARNRMNEMKMRQQAAAPKADHNSELVEKFDKMAQNYIDNGDFDGAVETYITALKLSPGNTELREKLHRIYAMVAAKTSGDRIWEKLDKSPVDKLQEAKEKALEERQKKILDEEHERARRLLEEEARIQEEYEKQELEIIQKAAMELKSTLDAAQKEQKLKEEEIQKIMQEQEAKKKALLEKLKREAIDKFNKQKELIREQAGLPPLTASAPAAEPVKEPEPVKQPEAVKEPEPVKAPEPVKEPEQGKQPEKMFTLKPVNNPNAPLSDDRKKSLFDALKGAYATPSINKSAMETAKEAKEKETQPQVQASKKTGLDRIEEIIGGTKKEEDIKVNEETLDSLVTTAYIYINQDMLKEALHITNKLSEKFPEHAEVRQLIEEISKKQPG